MHRRAPAFAAVASRRPALGLQAEEADNLGLQRTVRAGHVIEMGAVKHGHGPVLAPFA